jgi:hypothetical protein
VTITYPNGTILQAIALSHEENEIRSIAAGCDDVLEFTRVHDTWISEEIEPVTIEFACQRRQTSPSISEDDCLCPKELAARLIAMVISGCERGEAGKGTFFVFSAEGGQVAIQRTGLYDSSSGPASGKARSARLGRITDAAGQGPSQIH